MTPAEARQIRDARRARVRRIRGRVIGYSVALFCVVWSLIAVLMVTGHDPALSRPSHRTSATSSSGASAAGDGSTTGSGSSDSAGSGSSDSAGSGSSSIGGSGSGEGSVGPLGPVTSGQS